MEYSEKQLIDMSKSGNIDAFELLIENYQKKVFNIAYRVIGNYDDANDLAQEVLIRIFKSIGGFREQSSFSTWVYRITTNVCLDELRRRKNKKVISLDEDIQFEDSDIKRQVVSGDPTPEEIAEEKETKDIIHRAINKLSDEHKVVIVLRDLQGFSYEEIARVTKCPEGTVKSRINRARQALKEILQKDRELLIKQHVK